MLVSRKYQKLKLCVNMIKLSTEVQKRLVCYWKDTRPNTPIGDALDEHFHYVCEDGKAQTITKLLFSSVSIHAVPFHSLSGLFERSNYFVVSQDNVRCYWGVRYACVKVCVYIHTNRYIYLHIHMCNHTKLVAREGLWVLLNNERTSSSRKACRKHVHLTGKKF